MFHIVMINLSISVAALIAILILIKGWSKRFKKDTKLILSFLLLLILVHGILNVFEWSGMAPWIDQLGDLIENLEPLIWVFFFYVYLKEVDERKIKRNEKKYRELFESLKTGIIVQGADGEILSVNPAAQKILGLDMESLKKQSLRDWSVVFYNNNEEPIGVDELQVLWNSKEGVEGEIIGIADDGKRIKWYSVNAVPYLTEDGDIERVITSFEDITKTKKAEEKKNFLNTMIRQDLASKFSTIRGYMELMDEERLSKKDLSYLLGGLERSREVDEILQLATDLKEVEEINYPIKYDAVKMIQHAIDDISNIIEEKNIKVEEKYSDHKLMIHVDYSFEKLFVHLLKTRIQLARCDRIRIKVEEKGNHLCVMIEDNGADLPDEVKDIFSGKMYDGRTSGAGGVLYYMIREIAEHNEADIEVKTPESGWTRFEVYMKRVQ
ncbi:MAG: PAS domain S-box protein [Candidatus Saliniplasma sp.]